MSKVDFGLDDQTPTQEDREAVARGAALLDEKRPGWYDEIDLGMLEMQSCYRCVLGQLYSLSEIDDEDGFPLTSDPLSFVEYDPYSRGINQLKLRDHDAWGLGFEASIPFDYMRVQPTQQYPRLNAAWKEAIIQRRSAQMSNTDFDRPFPLMAQQEIDRTVTTSLWNDGWMDLTLSRLEEKHPQWGFQAQATEEGTRYLADHKQSGERRAATSLRFLETLIQSTEETHRRVRGEGSST